MVEPVAQAPVGKVHRLAAGIVDLNPVRESRLGIGGNRVVARHDLADKHPGLVHRPQVDVHLVESGLVVRQRRRGDLKHLELSLVVPAPAAVHRQVVDHHAVQDMALAVRQDDRLVFRADPEVGVRRVLDPVHPVLAGAQHQVVTAGGNLRAVREAPLERFPLVVAQPQALQGKIPVGRVVQLDPVAQLVLVVPQAGHGIRHDLVDHDAPVFHRDALAVLPVPFLGVFEPGTEPGHIFESAVRQGPAFVAGHDRVFAAVDQISVRIIKVYRLSDTAQLELRVESPVRIALVGVVAEHDHPSVCLQADIREQETDPVSLVAQAQTLEIDRMIGAVPDLDPVGIVAVLIRHCGGVGGHDLADYKSGIGAQVFMPAAFHHAGLCSGGIGCPADRFLRRDNDQYHDHGGNAEQQEEVHSGFPAAQFGCPGSGTAPLGIRIFFHPASLLSFASHN